MFKKIGLLLILILVSLSSVNAYIGTGLFGLVEKPRPGYQHSLFHKLKAIIVGDRVINYDGEKFHVIVSK
jgi:hypothetical protein